MQLLNVNKVLSSKSKMKILFLLYTCEESMLNVNDLCCELKLSQPNLSRHLQEMHKLNVVDYKQEGKQKIYALNKSWKQKWNNLLELNFNLYKKQGGSLCC